MKKVLSPLEQSNRVKRYAREIGFDLVGVTTTSVPTNYAHYLRAMEAGYGAEMRWLTDAPERREDVRHIWPEARSVVVVAVSYASESPGFFDQEPSEDEGWISRYAQGQDYHHYVKRRLIRLAKRLEQDPEMPPHKSNEHRLFSDTGPVLEKAFAQAAGLGWIGKNSLLIHPGKRRSFAEPPSGRGSWYFLGVMLTPLELAPDSPEVDHCGTCTRCMDACPTGAIVAPYVLDARQCISNWTIESPHPGEVIRPEALGQHIFGCDICQEVCPWNRKITPSEHEALLPRPENIRPKIEELVALDEREFQQRFPNSAVRRISPAQLRETVDAIREGQALRAADPGDERGGG